MAAGLPPGDFWAVTPGEVVITLRGASDRIARDAEQAKRLIYAQAVLNSFAWHKPGKMPDFDRFFGAGRGPTGVAQSPEQMMRILQDWTAKTRAAGLQEIH